MLGGALVWKGMLDDDEYRKDALGDNVYGKSQREYIILTYPPISDIRNPTDVIATILNETPLSVMGVKRILPNLRPPSGLKLTFSTPLLSLPRL